MSDNADLDDFLDKWRGRWPEWRIAQVFVPEMQRPQLEAWFALQQEWTDAAWAGDDPTPGFAKLGWWQDELRGWSKGLRRHPLGLVLQKQPAPWGRLADTLPRMQQVREPLRAWGASEAPMSTMQPLADAVAACESALFGPAAVVESNAFSLLAAHALWHREDADDAARARDWARQLLVPPAKRAGSRPGRIHAGLSRGRLQQLVDRGEVTALGPWSALWLSWRAA